MSVDISNTLNEHRDVDSMGNCSCGRSVSHYGASTSERSDGHRRHLVDVLNDRLRVDQNSRLTETCSCGASISVEMWQGAASAAVAEWRGGHFHPQPEPPVRDDEGGA